jgi:hypothetical protein
MSEAVAPPTFGAFRPDRQGRIPKILMSGVDCSAQAVTLADRPSVAPPFVRTLNMEDRRANARAPSGDAGKLVAGSVESCANHHKWRVTSRTDASDNLHQQFEALAEIAQRLGLECVLGLLQDLNRFLERRL